MPAGSTHFRFTFSSHPRLKSRGSGYGASTPRLFLLHSIALPSPFTVRESVPPSLLISPSTLACRSNTFSFHFFVTPPSQKKGGGACHHLTTSPSFRRYCSAIPVYRAQKSPLPPSEILPSSLPLQARIFVPLFRHTHDSRAGGEGMCCQDGGCCTGGEFYCKSPCNDSCLSCMKLFLLSLVFECKRVCCLHLSFQLLSFGGARHKPPPPSGSFLFLLLAIAPAGREKFSRFSEISLLILDFILCFQRSRHRFLSSCTPCCD